MTRAERMGSCSRRLGFISDGDGGVGCGVEGMSGFGSR